MSDEMPVPKSSSGQDLPWRGYKLAEVNAVLSEIEAERWTWCRNTQAKYIKLLIDTRDGGFVRIQDRDGNAITLDELRHQYRPTPPSGA